jgi:S1-C subfamily serine protease
MSTVTTSLAALSADLSAAVAAAAASVAYVDAHPRRDASGIVWDEHHVVTVDHAIDREEDIELLLADGATARAALVGRDASTDVALLRTDSHLKPARRADVSGLAVGNLVLAVGRDEDAMTGASFGIVSALDGPWRTWRGGDVDRFVRPDLSVFPAFSGGPLVDVAGAVVGMNTWGLSRRTALTLPVTTLERIVRELGASGRIRRGYLGVALQTVRLPQALRAAYGLSQGTGAIVVDAAPDGPAERAGITIGDLLVALGGVTIEDSEDLQRALGSATVGATKKLRVIRGNEAREVEVTLAERPQNDE